jgi:hypothetical protein
MLRNGPCWLEMQFWETSREYSLPALTDVSKRSTILLMHTPSDYAERNEAECSDTKSPEHPIRHSPTFDIVVETGACRAVRIHRVAPENHLRHSRFVALREDKDSRKVRKEI